MKSRAQSTFEFMFLITAVLGCLMTMGLYFRRGLQGRWQASVDDLGEQYDISAMNGTITYIMSGKTKTRITTVPANDEGVWTMRADEGSTFEQKTGSTRVAVPIH